MFDPARLFGAGMAPDVRYAAVDEFGNSVFNATREGALRRASRTVTDGSREATVYVRGPPHEVIARYSRGEDGKAHKVFAAPAVPRPQPPREPPMRPLTPSRWCGQTEIEIVRRDDGGGYDCAVGTGRQRWSGIVPVPFRLTDDGSPELLDELARTAVDYAVAAGFDKRVNFDLRGGVPRIRRRSSYKSPTF